jgi:hypothetical protein
MNEENKKHSTTKHSFSTLLCMSQYLDMSSDELKKLYDEIKNLNEVTI